MQTKNCQDCIYAVRPKGRNGTALVCINKKGANGSLFFTEKQNRCRNFRHKRGYREKLKQPSDSDIRFIPLTKGKVAIVDAEDYERLSKYKWHTVISYKRFYAYRTFNGKNTAMHRFIMKPAEGLLVDHIDGNGLNNTKDNLRICTYQQNICNRKGWGKNSKYKGLCWDKYNKKWRAQIHYNRKCRYLGVFEDEVEAAKEYDKEAIRLFGEFAYLNFPAEYKALKR